MKNLLIILFALALFSCKLTSKIIDESKEVVLIKDSTYHSLITKIDTVFFPGQTLEVLIPYEVLKRDTVLYYKEGVASAKIISSSGFVTIQTTCDSLQKLVLSTNEKLFKLQDLNKELTQKFESEKVITIPIPWYYKMALWITVILIGIGSAHYFINRFINPKN